MRTNQSTPKTSPMCRPLAGGFDPSATVAAIITTALGVTALLAGPRPTATQQAPIDAQDISEQSAGKAVAGARSEVEPKIEADMIELDTFYVTATRSRTKAFLSPFSQHRVTSEDIFRQQYRTTPEALRDIPGVMVQKTAFGHGSPFIRGFTSFRNLFLIDGIRLNGPHFRPGPNQYWNTVDQGSIAALEVVKGPSSVMWGSDGIGGTVNAITKSPDTYGRDTPYRATTFLRFSSAEESFIGRQEFAANVENRLGFIGGFGGKVFGDLRTGGRVQDGVGYDEWNGDFKTEFFLNENVRLVGAHYQVRQNNVPRSHKTVDAVPFEGTTIGDELSRELDQERDLTYLQLIGENFDGFINGYRASISWQRQEQVRDRRRPGVNPGDPPRRDLQGFEVGTLGFFTHLQSRTDIGRLTYGIEYYHSNVNSFRTGSTIQGPLGDEANTDQLGLFLQNQFSATDRLHFTVGGRFNYAAVDADSVEDPDTGNRIRVDDEWSSFVGSARATYEIVPDELSLFGGVSQGFRAPNLGDLTRFDTARTDEFEIPAPGLEEEEYLTFEIGSKLSAERASAQVSYFYTDISDQILRFPTGDGRDTDSDGVDDEFEVTKDNVGDGQVFGIEFAGAWQFAPGWTLFGNATYIEGEVTNFVGDNPANQVLREEYLSRLMPLTGQVGLRWESPTEPVWLEGQLRLADDADKLSSRDRDDTQRIPPGGTPGYAVLNLRGGWDIKSNLSITVAVENITDENFRIHGSGQNEPGRNFILSVRTEF